MAIHIIGLGAAAQAVLTANAMQALDRSQVIIGSPRQLETVSIYLGSDLEGDLGSDSEFIVQPRLIELPKLNELKALLAEISDQQVSILASGDPLYFGIGRWLSKNINTSELFFYPGVSSIQAACHKLGFSLQDCDAISLHGRPVETLRSLIRHNQTLVILTDKYSQPKRLAQECFELGYHSAKITVCEDLGYEKERVRSFSIEALLAGNSSSSAFDFSELQVTVIETGTSEMMPQFPGFNDALFITGKAAGKGLITKREVRLAVLSLLQPSRGDVAWDVGAGCGGIAVEWAYWNKAGQVHAIEHNDQRFDCLQQNTQRFGVVDNLIAIQGRAPAVLDSLPQANKIFIGGSDGEMSELLAFCWMQLPANGVLVVSAVMENTKQQLLTFRDELLLVGSATIETSQIAISRGEELAGQLVYRPNLAVTLFRFQKNSI
ncbi:MAG: precorrin-6y C5,15-methyltransferase (decarboxylating) subunit CbiE [Oleispira sp.]